MSLLVIWKSGREAAEERGGEGFERELRRLAAVPRGEVERGAELLPRRADLRITTAVWSETFESADKKSRRKKKRQKTKSEQIYDSI